MLTGNIAFKKRDSISLYKIINFLLFVRSNNLSLLSITFQFFISKQNDLKAFVVTQNPLGILYKENISPSDEALPPAKDMSSLSRSFNHTIF